MELFFLILAMIFIIPIVVSFAIFYFLFWLGRPKKPNADSLQLTSEIDTPETVKDLSLFEYAKSKLESLGIFNVYESSIVKGYYIYFTDKSNQEKEASEITLLKISELGFKVNIILYHPKRKEWITACDLFISNKKDFDDLIHRYSNEYPTLFYGKTNINHQ